MFGVLDRHIGARSRGFMVAFTVSTVMALGAVDYVTGREISFSIFYIFPIALASWYMGRRPGYGVVALATLVWFVSDIYSGRDYSTPLIPVWNSVVRLFFFTMTVLFMGEIKQRLYLEELLADTDELSGLKNRRAFFEHLELEIQRSRRHGRSLTLAYIDLDNFKSVNDSFGHDVGDEVLRTVSSVIQAKVRGMDIISRLGGDEFACLFPESGYVQAERIIRKLLGVLGDEMKRCGWPVTFSLGAATFSSPSGSARDLLNIVDELMYRVKREGKDSYLHRDGEAES